MISDDTGVIMKYPSFEQFVDGQFTEKQVTEESVLAIIANSIDQIFQVKKYMMSLLIVKGVSSIVESLTNKQLDSSAIP